MYVLAIDTSSPAVTVGVVLLEDTHVTLAAERAPLAARGHGELLSPAIADCLGDAGLAPADIDAVVAGVGPGPFTGLRVGIVTAAAFADAIAAPTYGVCSLDAIASQGQDDGDVVVLTDARRREVYWARYGADGQRTEGPAVGPPAEVDVAGADIAGAAAELYADLWPSQVRLPYRYPSPAALVGWARERVESAALSELLEPMYLRRPDAVVPGAPKTVSR